ncbi:MAG: ribosome maturation factor RimP [Erysipelotrichaceae bacterium]|nr:ribosome maturation factor RimP [Erysipelotrichaceae bacterium]
MDLTDKIKEQITPLINERKLQLYDIEWLLENNTRILRVIITNPNGIVDIDMCSEVSEAISVMLDNLTEIDDQYYLEVCSPGAERPLRNLDEIKAALNDYVYVKFKNPKAGLNEVTGILSSINDNSIQIQYKRKTRDVNCDVLLENIAFIRLAIKF